MDPRAACVQMRNRNRIDRHSPVAERLARPPKPRGLGLGLDLGPDLAVVLNAVRDRRTVITAPHHVGSAPVVTHPSNPLRVQASVGDVLGYVSFCAHARRDGCRAEKQTESNRPPLKLVIRLQS